jgi:uncharacterized protein with beta-barrel porin domain
MRRRRRPTATAIQHCTSISLRLLPQCFGMRSIQILYLPLPGQVSCNVRVWGSELPYRRRRRTPFGAVAGLNANQRAVGNALEGAYRTTLTGSAAQLYTNLLMTGTPDALSQLSGEGTTAAQNTAFASGAMFGALLMDQGAFWRSGETADSEGVTYREAPLAYAAEKKKPTPAAFKALKASPLAYQPRNWRVWTGGFGGVQSFNGDAFVGSADARTAAAGGAMGFDYQVDPTRLVGVAVGGSESHFSVPDRATSGNLLGGHVGAYGVAT